MAVAAWQRERVLAAEGGDPQVVGWDGFADALEFLNDFGIVMRGWIVDVQHEGVMDQACEAVFPRRRGGK